MNRPAGLLARILYRRLDPDTAGVAEAGVAYGVGAAAASRLPSPLELAGPVEARSAEEPRRFAAILRPVPYVTADFGEAILFAPGGGESAAPPPALRPGQILALWREGRAIAEATVAEIQPISSETEP